MIDFLSAVSRCSGQLRCTMTVLAKGSTCLFPKLSPDARYFNAAKKILRVLCHFTNLIFQPYLGVALEVGHNNDSKLSSGCGTTMFV